MGGSTASITGELKGLLERQLRPLQTIHLALAGGVLAFGAVIGVLWMQPPHHANEEAVRVCVLMGAVTVPVLVACWTAALVLFRVRTAPALLRAVAAERGAAGVYAAFASAAILRAALIEAPALMGMVVLMTGVTGGALHVEPLLWAAGLPAVLQVAAMAVLLPRPEAVYGFLAERVSLD